MKNKIITMLVIGLMSAIQIPETQACTGITLKSKDGNYIMARTIEWGGSKLNSGYVVVPRGYKQQSMTPTGINGVKFTAKYGYVGLTVEQKEFVTEGINEAGLSAGLFYFPGYGQYKSYDPKKNKENISDFQLVSWILSNFATVDEVKNGIDKITITALDPRASTVHWRVGDKNGQQIVIEIVNGEVRVFDNKLGVLTNSPGFEWQMTNLNNYVNLYPGTARPIELDSVQVASFGAGSGMLGLPGDVTPPSRFVRAAFYQATAPQYNTSKETITQAFHIMNNFDIPIGVEHEPDNISVDIQSATQWTTATDLTNRTIYYRTAWNSTIRCIDLNQINFENVQFVYSPLDKTEDEPIEMIKIE